MNRSVRAALSLGLVVVVLAGTTAVAVLRGEWGSLIFVAVAVAIYAVAFRSKLNPTQAVPTDHGVDGQVDAVEFFWRPG
ncbi:MAG: hypothetical protein AAFO29_01300 [Actinomycetota bacterium]